MINHSEKEYMKMHTGITESLFCRAEINIVNTYFNKYTDFKKLHFFYEESGLCFTLSSFYSTLRGMPHVMEDFLEATPLRCSRYGLRQTRLSEPIKTKVTKEGQSSIDTFPF